MQGIQKSSLLTTVLAAFIALQSAVAVPPPAGIAPVDPPPNGFDIDGNLLANTPNANVGDWVSNTNLAPGSGGSVLTWAGVPINATRTFHFRDPYNGSDNVFVGGLKWKDNPNTWGWTTNKASSKTDVQNVMIHLTSDTNGHTWAVLSADRYSTAGDSYIDFEFLQSILTANGNGTFSSAGTNGGRIVGDFVLSLAFISGGSVADFYYYRWQTNGSGGYDYVDSTASLPAGRVFIALNTNSTVVPYGAFGTTNYAANAFVEAAVDLSAMLGGFDPCSSFGFNTIMVKTKTSASDTASISDFLTPFQYPLRIGPDAQAGPDQVRCSQGASTAFAIAGSAGSGLSTVATNFWTVLVGDATIDTPASLSTTARLASGSATLRLTVVQANGCVETDDVVLTVQQPPVCAITGASSVCPRTTNSFSAPPGLTSYAWTVSGGGTISGPANQATVKVVAGSICGTNYTVSLSATTNVCSIACSTQVAVTDATMPVLTIPADRLLDCPAVTTTNATGTATATDSCSRVTVTYTDYPTNTCGNTRVIARVWTATDECGNAVSATQTITVRDITAPVITCPVNRTLECPANTATNNTGVATATDSCSTPVVTFNDLITTNCGNTFVISRVWTATDACGNSSTCTQTITVRDITAPVITCPPSATLQCPADTSTNSTGFASATDTCGETAITFIDTITNLCGNTRTISRRWTATDLCGNSSTCTQTITVRDTNAPVITCPANVTLECPANTTTNNTGVATATDACSTPTVTFTDTTTNVCPNGYTISRRWTATDGCGNQSSCIQTIKVQDTTAPAINCPADVTLEYPAVTTTNATGRATASDACGTVTIVYQDTVTTNCGNTVTISRRWTATDQCNNSATCTQTISVRDSTAPVITCPPSATLECPANTTTNANGRATATDNSGSAVITFTDSVQTNCANTSVISRTWRATDACGNFSTCVQTLTVRDITPPVITCPANRTLECPADTSTNNTGVATATDTCSGVTISFSDSTASTCGGAGVLTRTWRATDGCGNVSTCAQTITVRDTTPPSISIKVGCTYSPAEWLGSQAGLLDSDYSQVFPQGIAIGIYTPTNGATAPNGLVWSGNNPGLNALETALASSGPAGVITADASNPGTVDGGGVLGQHALALALNIGFNTSGQLGAGANNFGSLVYSNTADSLSGKSVTQILDAANKALAGLGTPSGYTLASLTTLLTNLNASFQDCAASVFARTRLSQPALTASCGSQVPPSDWSLVTYSDTCSSVTLTALPEILTNQTCGNHFTIIRRWQATDACGNSASISLPVVVNDDQIPVITCPPNVTVEYPDSVLPATTGTATATDNCGTVNFDYSDTSTNLCGNSRIITRTWRAWDSCINIARCTQLITVQDTTPPAITCPQNVTLECGQNTAPSANGTATATDLSGVSSITYADTITTNCGNTFTISRRWTATDSCGNASSCTQTISVRDTIAPWIICPANKTLECPADTSTNNTGFANSADACNAVTITFSDSSAGTCANARIISRTWRSTDACGNFSTCVQTLTIRDTVPPIITAPPNVTLECGASTATSNTGTATASDACNSVTVSYSDSASNSCGNARVILRRWLAMDSCNNSNVAIQTLTIRDTTPPALTLPSNRVLDCPGNTTTNNTGFASATDVCGSVTISCSDVVSNSCGITKTIWRTWTATDQCGNASSGVQTINVRNVGPTISCRAVSVQCPRDLPPPYASLSAFLAGGSTASSPCDASLTFALMSDSGLVGACPGRVTRVYRVTDDCGNFAECAQTITVDDTIAPVLTCPGGTTVECGTSLEATNLITATDNCSTNVVITRTDVPVQSEYDVSWYAADPAANSAPYLPTYLRLAPGSLPCPTGGRALDPLRNAVAFGPTGSQLDALTSLSGEGMSLGQIAPFEAVIDVSGAPGPEHGTIEFKTSWSTYTTSNDRFGFDKNYMVYCAFVDAADMGSIDPLANARVESFSSTIINSNTIDEKIVGTFRVTGLDPGDRVIVEVWMVLMSTQPDRVGGTIASDLVSAQKVTTPPQPISVGGKTISISAHKFDPLPAPQPQPPLGQLPQQPPVPPGATVSVIDRTWAATDDCGNRSTCVQRLTIRDTTPPALVVTTNLVFDCPADTSTNSIGSATAVDACGSATLIYSDVVSNGAGNARTIWRTWTAFDQNNNTNSVVQTITVRDITPPALTVPADLVLDCPVTDFSTNSTGTATAVDACGLATLTYSDVVSNSCGNTKTLWRTWTAFDQNNNTNTGVQKITVRDITPPALTVGADKAITAGTALAFDPAVATDTCGSAVASVINTFTNTLSGGSYSVTRTWRATDACDNQSADKSQTITVTPVQAQLTKLTITQIPNPGILLRWPTNAADYRLECADSPSAKRWYPVVAPIIGTNGECRVYLSRTATCQVFRLSSAPPFLDCARVGANLRLTWPTAPTGFQLEASDTMLPGSWSPVLQTPISTNSIYQLDVPRSTARKFYRLKK